MPPLRFERFAPEVRAVVWEGEESSEDLLAALPAGWRGRLPKHDVRVKETLSARLALLALVPDAAEAGFEKDEFGKPHLNGEGALNFSLTHSHGHAAAIVSAHACGIDLQLRVEKIVKLRSKFEREDERAFIDRQPDEIAALHVLWGAKEALFKLWGRRDIDWHENLIVFEFELAPGGGAFKGEVRKNGEVIPAKLWFRWVEDFCLVAAVADLDNH
ncbi:MAG: 4'-phosphopantetheinyl transferase superfamily protein [Saprospiraceae bacterium]